MNRAEIKKEVDSILYSFQLVALLQNTDHLPDVIMYYDRVCRQLEGRSIRGRRFWKIFGYRFKTEAEELGLGEIRHLL
jgi:hypothetical protein